MKYYISLMIALVAFCGLFNGSALAADKDTYWYWISSDNKYSKFYAPTEVQIMQNVGGVPTQINAITKTTYDLAGAKETLTNYGIKNIKPEDLMYSIANVQVVPQRRTLAYLDETFYNKQGQKIWSKKYQPLKPKEINSQEFDEDYYAYILDTVFGAGEVVRRTAEDRWLVMWQEKTGNGQAYAMADTTTMRLNGENIIYWEWQEFKDNQGNVQEIRFQKKAVNVPQGTEKIVRYLHWDSKGWQDYTDSETDGNYYAITPGSRSAKAQSVLKIYEGNHEAWVNRYSIENLD